MNFMMHLTWKIILKSSGFKEWKNAKAKSAAENKWKLRYAIEAKTGKFEIFFWKRFIKIFRYLRTIWQWLRWHFIHHRQGRRRWWRRRRSINWPKVKLTLSIRTKLPTQNSIQGLFHLFSAIPRDAKRFPWPYLDHSLTVRAFQSIPVWFRLLFRNKVWIQPIIFFSKFIFRTKPIVSENKTLIISLVQFPLF